MNLWLCVAVWLVACEETKGCTVELNGLEWSGGCVECGCRDNASSGSSGHIENALPAESNDRDANSTNWEV